jgi:hypothetical protein
VKAGKEQRLSNKVTWRYLGVVGVGDKTNCGWKLVVLGNSRCRLANNSVSATKLTAGSLGVVCVWRGGGGSTISV